MRVKTDTRRKAIVDAAWEVFKASGFERTSMSDISTRVGGSKATLYSYFKSKDELFAAAMEQAVRDRLGDAFDQAEASGDVGERLLGFARTYMDMRLATDMIAADRVLIAQADQSDLGLVLLRRFVVPEWEKLAAMLERKMEAGVLRQARPYLAAMHFRGLIEGDLLERRLHGDDTITPQDVDIAIVSGVDAFLRAYLT
ncbi:TetR/AcrR family transcriptional regulator [Brevundimonas sp.]|uniref:TetR/AcrR family transcriptional regulator n=1 Tax=Brevundimonas sp. TaxID=1871086 RepID=UPI0017B8A8A6|nr:TetR/AcrR family transcriptional regulator [Brevundimonas sp.]MBA4809251.1 TetR/AcrR family transcriptional regulator [Brevundimonas sp.]